MKNFSTQQEDFWAGSFGNEYISRNADNHLIASNISLFSKIFNKIGKIHNVIEFGPNIGLNLFAIHQLLPDVALSGVEINEKAVEQLKQLDFVNVFHESILEFSTDFQWDFVFTKGVLIHINPDYLNNVYEIMFKTSKKYICIIEYYNPSPVEIPYRGHRDRLFKRDFAGELMGYFNSLELIDYGFIYHNDINFPQDDLTWFLLKKS
ncbi:MAG TPA: pseudaminic acid biosynthesis-associated methylase [Methanolinea sp.]|nr:pseudaminic acid biosynthesis-associated methylase [Methanolinea sp.]